LRAQTLTRHFADGRSEKAYRLPAWTLELMPPPGFAHGLLTNVAEQAGTGRYEQER
jgi:hypothetical protein